MIRKSVQRPAEKIMRNQESAINNLKRDGDSTSSHRALVGAMAVRSRRGGREPACHPPPTLHRRWRHFHAGPSLPGDCVRGTKPFARSV
jgi:hypothetical protein